MSMKKAFYNGMVTLGEYQSYLQKEFSNPENKNSDFLSEYEKVMKLKTYWCITYTKYYNDGRIENPHLSDIENTDNPPINSIQEREDFAVYHEWYSDFKYVNVYLDQLQGVINQYE